MLKKGLPSTSIPQNPSSARQQKLQPLANTLSHKNKPVSAFTSISSIGHAHNADKVQRKILLNDEILMRRKENHLNTQYNRRLNALKNITKENKKIYQRINSQKSLYSQDDMRKSSMSIRSSKSSSRVSQRSGQHQASMSRNSKVTKPKIAMTIQPESVGNLRGDNIKQFKSVFMIEKKHSQNREDLAGQRRQNRSFSLRNDDKMGKDNQMMGNMLHKIAE